MRPKRGATKKGKNSRKSYKISKFWVIFPIIMSAIVGLVDTGTKVLGHFGPKTTASQPAPNNKNPINPVVKRDPPIKPKDLSEELKRTMLVQALLKNAGFDPGPIDGIHGELTQSAVRKFQNRHGLPETGSVDRKTLNALGIKTIPNPLGRDFHLIWSKRFTDRGFEVSVSPDSSSWTVASSTPPPAATSATLLPLDSPSRVVASGFSDA